MHKQCFQYWLKFRRTRRVFKDTDFFFFIGRSPDLLNYILREHVKVLVVSSSGGPLA